MHGFLLDTSRGPGSPAGLPCTILGQCYKLQAVAICPQLQGPVCEAGARAQTHPALGTRMRPKPWARMLRPKAALAKTLLDVPIYLCLVPEACWSWPPQGCSPPRSKVHVKLSARHPRVLKVLCLYLSFTTCVASAPRSWLAFVPATAKRRRNSIPYNTSLFREFTNRAGC